MDIFTADHRRALRYIEAANRGGYTPTAAEVEEWHLRAERLPGRRGRLISEAIPAKPPPWASSLQMQIGRIELPTGLIGQINLPDLLGTQGRPAEYEWGPPETFLANMRRLTWLSQDDRGGLSLTPLSRALLRADAVDQMDEDDAQIVVLGADDPLAYGRLLGHIAEAGNVLVVDSYLKPEQLLDLVTRTDATRFLVCGTRRSEEVAMQAILALPNWPAGIELRKTAPKTLHDRYIVSDSVVYSLGTSLNSVGQNPTLLIQLPEVAADPVRAAAEAWWAGANVLETSPGPQRNS